MAAALQTLRSLVTARLNAAAEEILGVFSGTVSRYEEELQRHRDMLQLLLRPESRLLRAADPMQLSTTSEKEVPPEQERSHSLDQEERRPSLDQEEREAQSGPGGEEHQSGPGGRGAPVWDQEERRPSLDQEERRPSLDQDQPEPPHVKEEQEELWSSQEGDQLHGLEADIIKFTSTPVPVKSDYDEEKPQCPWFNQTQPEENRVAESLAAVSTEQMETEPDGEDCGASESASETDHGVDWNETMEPQSGLNASEQRSSPNRLKRSMESTRELKSSIHDSSRPCCKVCKKYFHNKVSLSRHIRNHASDCGLCGKHLEPGESLKLHRQAHSTCGVCGKIFTCIANLERHVVTHTGEKRFCCALCGKGFSQKVDLRIHTITHSEDKPFSCTGCGKQFNRKAVLARHMKTHTGEKAFSCMVCGETFRQKEHLQSHMLMYTGEKPYTCSVCGQAFCHLETFNRHMCQAGVFSYNY